MAAAASSKHGKRSVVTSSPSSSDEEEEEEDEAYESETDVEDSEEEYTDVNSEDDDDYDDGGSGDGDGEDDDSEGKISDEERCKKVIGLLQRCKSLDMLKLEECKAYLRKYELRISGTKATCIERILEHWSPGKMKLRDQRCWLRSIDGEQQQGTSKQFQRLGLQIKYCRL